MDADRQALSGRRAALLRVMRLLRGAFSRAEISGLEHLPARGPLLVCFNHLSILDGPLVVSAIPHEVELVGPGDFPMTSIEEGVVRAYGITRINRGRTDRASLRALLAHLEAGRILAMAPDGGTWEKAITDVKTGAAYLSQALDVPILPVGLGGLYAVPVVDVGKLLTRPRISIRFGPLMPPVPPSASRRARQADLEAASLELMQRIYALLPAEDQARYDRWGRARYDLEVAFEPYAAGHSLNLADAPRADMSALGEFVAKRNLFRPMHVNAGLNVDPFLQPRYFSPMEVRLAARDLYRTLTQGDYDAYLYYRLGDNKAGCVLEALRALRDEITAWALDHHARLQLRPVVVSSAPDGGD